MNEEIIGYHGTKKDNVESILINNFKINEDKYNKLFLGAGIYFFNICGDAVDWNIKSFIKEFSYLPEWNIYINKYSVIKSKINVNKEDILDLDEKENLYKFEMLVEKIKGKLEKKSEFLRAKNKTSAIINMMYCRNLINKKVIIKTFVEQINVKNLNSFKNYSRKMFCVKDEGIIKENKEKIDIDEEMFNSIVYFYK